MLKIIKVLLVSGALILSGLGTPASAEALGTEADLVAIAAPLQDEALSDYQRGPVPGSLSTAFGSVLIDIAEHRVDIYWKGSPTRELVNVLESSPSNVQIYVHETPYSLADMEVAKEKLLNLSQSMRTTDQVIVRALNDNSSLVLQVSSLTPGKALGELLSAFRLFSGVPVKVEYSVDANNESTSRPADASPYSGGALIGIGLQNFTVYCSSGFGVQSATSGVNYILTANHCFHTFIVNSNTSASVFSGTDGQGFFDGHTTVGTWQNTTGYNKPVLDLSLYRPSSGVSANTIYTGAISSNSKVVISKAMNPVVGETVCTSGGMSGAHCDLSVDSVNGSGTFQNGDGTTFAIASNLASAHSLSNGIAVAKGDSGGPVYDYQTGVYVGLGIITGGFGQFFNCPVISTYCFSRVYFTQLPLDLSTINMSLR